VPHFPWDAPVYRPANHKCEERQRIQVGRHVETSSSVDQRRIVLEWREFTKQKARGSRGFTIQLPNARYSDSCDAHCLLYSASFLLLMSDPRYR
jgi:hypothetical protein